MHSEFQSYIFKTSCCICIFKTRLQGLYMEQLKEQLQKDWHDLAIFGLTVTDQSLKTVMSSSSNR